MAGLLGDIYSAADSIKRRFKGLLFDPVGEAQQALGMLADDAKVANERNKRMIHNPEQITEQDMRDSFNSVMNFAPIGMTVWHGSPHKFSKFDMSKIGTGEGAQAYGHGLYMAESDKVAKTYAESVKKPMNSMFAEETLQATNPDLLKRLYEATGNDKYSGNAGAAFMRPNDFNLPADLKKEIASFKKNASNLYKVDIPDEAVARFLDWDKPLSQQAPEVQAALQKAGIGVDKQAVGAFDDALLAALEGTGSTTLPKQPLNPAGESVYRKLGGADVAAEKLRALGVPGIRYLDGGSRSAGQGSSNFVLFDDQLPRILEVNGVPTGNVQWKPGEWQGLLGKIPEAPRAEAMRIAQQNAAKPVSEGGLGLRPDNTPMERAKAMGFDTDLFHGRYSDYENIKDGRTFYATPDPAYASVYTNPSASSMGGKTLQDFENQMPNVMPVKVRSADMLDTRTKSGRQVFNKDFHNQYGNGTPLSEKGLPDWVDAEDFGQMFEDKAMRYKGVLADEGGVPVGDSVVSRGISHAIFDPSAVRSRFAAFDPARRHEADLLGQVNPELLPWLIGGGLLGGYGVKQAQE